MVEAIKHLKDGINFKDTDAIAGKEYKKLARNNCNNNLEKFGESSEIKISKDNWDFIIKEHSKKANFITTGHFEFPEKLIEQLQIFSGQQVYIKNTSKVSVLSGFPLFLLDYYGIKKFKD